MQSNLFLQTLLGGVATLIATLIGVRRGFQKDRKAEQQRRVRTTIQHLKAIDKELTLNSGVASGNHQLINSLLDGDNEHIDHYSIDIYSTDAWDAAVNDKMIEHISEDIYSDIQEIYSITKRTNELIMRVQTEPLHPQVGEKQEWGEIEFKKWSISVNYWDEESETIKQAELGELIKRRSNRINIGIQAVNQSLEDEIRDLEEDNPTIIEELLGDKSYSPPFLRY